MHPSLNVTDQVKSKSKGERWRNNDDIKVLYSEMLRCNTVSKNKKKDMKKKKETNEI